MRAVAAGGADRVLVPWSRDRVARRGGHLARRDLHWSALLPSRRGRGGPCSMMRTSGTCRG